MFLQRSHVRNLLAAVVTGYETEQFAMLWLMAYVFLLRVPSEALPVERGEAGVSSDGQAVLFLEVCCLGAVWCFLFGSHAVPGCWHSLFEAKESQESSGRKCIAARVLLRCNGGDVSSAYSMVQVFH